MRCSRDNIHPTFTSNPNDGRHDIRRRRTGPSRRRYKVFMGLIRSAAKNEERILVIQSGFSSNICDGLK
jgi:hypothetical protein